MENNIFWKNQSQALNFIPTLISKNINFASEEFQCFKNQFEHYPKDIQLLFQCDEIEEIYVSKNQIKFRFTKTDKIQECKEKLIKTITDYSQSYNDSNTPLFNYQPIIKQQSQKSESSEFLENLKDFITKQIAPGLAGHGGTIEVISFNKGKLKVRFGGGCQGCSQIGVTVKEGILKSLRAPFPEVNEIIDLTNHQDGNNPYFT